MINDFKNNAFINKKRILCISDIHGNFLYFKQLLKKVTYNQNEDILILLGGNFSNGKEPLKLLNFVLQLNNCYIIKGEDEKALLNDPNKQNSFSLNEINFLKNLPDFIEIDNYYFVHKLPENYKDINKTIICGYEPTIHFHKIPNVNPFFKDNLIFIDGGVERKFYGQLNCLIIEQGNISYESYESTISMNTIINQEATKNPFYLSPNNAKIEIIGELDKGIKLVCYKGNYFAIDEKWITTKNNDSYAYEYTNYYLPIKKNEKIYVYKLTKYAYYAKKDGYLGWVKKEN